MGTRGSSDRGVRKAPVGGAGRREKVTDAKLHIHIMQSKSKKLEEHIQHLKRQQEPMAAKLEDQERRAHRNNIRVVGVPEGAEGPNVEFFLEDLILINLPHKGQSQFFSTEQAHRAPIPPPKPDLPR
ncbi:hypothetical protein NDU88_002936 [Pleurodeles waltl]|uniref:Uncharacterized protein n=1 Tax=Pleurodeles waltl TaxID=8319 RepID=A0AAV7VC03_PLEWA|nr:hypothetical protein NDU88_002936 [Pleurodeles waltl]